MTWSIRHTVNKTRADREFMQKWIRLTGGGTSKLCLIASFICKYTNRSQETLPEGATVVPIIGMSDRTNLTDFAGDKKAWPVYMTIGNVLSTIRNRPRSMGILLLGLLPIPPKLAKSFRAAKLQRLINADTLCGVFELIFASLNAAAREGAPIDCADGKLRRWFPIMSGWIADHMENVTLHGIKCNACPKCVVPPEELGS